MDVLIERETMKKMMMFVLCGFTGLNLVADDVRQPYVIHRKAEMVTRGEIPPFMQKEETLIVSNMPTFTVSEPLTNAFVFNNGEYVPPPIVVSVSNLAVLVNGIMIKDYESGVRRRESYVERVGVTPESVGKSVDYSAEYYVRCFQSDNMVYHFSNWSMQKSHGSNNAESILNLIEKARKAAQGDEQAKQELIKEMMLEYPISQSKVRTDWIERLATNTNLEARATRILEAKRERERQEQELRDQQNP